VEPVFSVVVIGVLDGVHRGHQAVLKHARGLVSEILPSGGKTRVLTFHPHPSHVVRGSAPPSLCTIERRIELLRFHGADEVIVEPFTKELAAWSPERFVRELIVGRLHAKAVVVGENFRYGERRSGDITRLRADGDTLGFRVESAPTCGDERGPFSSTRVREAVARGDLEEAKHVLGRRHSISGIVEAGDRVGRTLGFPTANLGGVSELLPPYGVYAAFADDRPAVVNLGVRPTMGGSALRVEAHLLDFEGDLYGSAMRLHFVRRLRGEQKFSGLDELRMQIARDVDAARAALDAAEGNRP
jgi:riboflavin kinase/FMN adenylyltransferase